MRHKDENAKQTVLWCDASVDSQIGIAFGAYMTREMKKPVVMRLKQTISVYAEIETMVRALLVMPKRTIVMTDLFDLQILLTKSKNSSARSMLQALAHKDATYIYVAPECRSQMYEKCHRAAIRRMRSERSRKRNERR